MLDNDALLEDDLSPGGSRPGNPASLADPVRQGFTAPQVPCAPAGGSPCTGATTGGLANHPTRH